MYMTDRILVLLKEQGSDQATLAKHLGKRASTVNYWFTKKKQIPHEYLPEVCKFLNTTEEYLISGTDEIPATEDKASENPPALAEDEAELLRIYRCLDREGRTMVLAAAYNHRARINGAGENKETTTTTA